MSQYYITAFKTGTYPPITVRIYDSFLVLNSNWAQPTFPSSKMSSTIGAVPTQLWPQPPMTLFPVPPAMTGLKYVLARRCFEVAC